MDEANVLRILKLVEHTFGNNAFHADRKERNLWLTHLQHASSCDLFKTPEEKQLFGELWAVFKPYIPADLEVNVDMDCQSTECSSSGV
jgi:hypothetical protein